MSRWKDTSKHWSKTEKRDEVLSKVVKYLRPHGFKGEYTPERLNKLQIGRKKYMDENKDTEQYKQSRIRATRGLIGNKHAYKNGNRSDPEKRKAISREKSRYYSLKEFGITVEQYNQMFVDQNGLCLICEKHETKKQNLSVDHCHVTGKVRGLLCSSCNLGIGNLKDSIEYLENAVKYLKKHI